MAASGSGKTRSGARRAGASRDRSDATGSLSHGLRWYVGGVVSGVFLSFMFYLVTLPPSGSAGSSRAGDPAPGVDTGAEKQPRFDFFDMLPQQRIEVEVEPGAMPGSREQSDASYLLQAGSFRQAEDADRRRAELLLLGLEPKVEATSGSNGRWYRVLVGPFDSRSRMAAARSLTAQQNIDTLLLKRSRP